MHRAIPHPWIKALSLAMILCVLTSEARTAQQSAPELFAYEELVQLYEQEVPPEPLRRKLSRLLSTPFVNNEASARGARPLKPRSRQLGMFLRVVFWNIERGLEYKAIEAAFTDPAKFSLLLDKKKYPRGSRQRAALLQQVELMKRADVIVLNEADWGLKRTDYRNVAADLARAAKMNYAFGVEFVEIDPITLGIEKFEEATPEDRAELTREIKVDPSRYKGLHGTAILSRYTLNNVRLIPFDNQGYDWYEQEKKGVARLEARKREASEKVFLEKVTREVRRGGRMMLLAEIEDPDIPMGKMTVVATHLEARTKPENRTKQLEELLSQVKEIDHPVVVAGDMNTSTTDMTPTSIKREIKKRLGSGDFWLKQGIKYATGVGLLMDVVIGGVKFSRTNADPTVRNVSFIAPNPTAEFFDKLKDFRFKDGGAFDFRGDRNRSAGRHTETLANSNERGGKGFVTTYEVERTIGPAGRFKLDWVFVKPAALTDPYDRGQPYRFAPHFGQTLKSLNYGVEDRISDHNPLVVDLPLGEPPIGGKRQSSGRD
jgi:endonuclease/exonuclease/phosphatase family metal-dependent hydrolase